MPISMVPCLCVITGLRCPLRTAAISGPATDSGRWIPIRPIRWGSIVIGGVIVNTNAAIPMFGGVA
jgi:hypothetical protein